MLSTAHHQKDVDLETSKPEIILHYNRTKGAVDTLDQMIEKSTCRRKTQRWTFNCFMYMLDAAASNSFALFNLRTPNKENNDEFRYRRKNLEFLATDLIKPLVAESTRRIKKFFQWNSIINN